MMLLLLILSLGLGSPSAAPEIVGERAADRARIQRNLAAVEADLRASDVDHLPPALQVERRRNLDRLHSYRLAGEFPRNSRHPGERVPYFIDDDGIVCAVGHLVVESGHLEVAQDIQRHENNARLLTMTHPALPAWIAASGLTAEECARIQPEYCECNDDYVPVCGVDGKNYINACQAETCAGVAVAHTGLCEEPGTTGWPSPGTTGDDSSSSSGSPGTGEATTTGTTTTDPGTTGTTGTDPSGDAPTGTASSTTDPATTAATTAATTGDEQPGPDAAEPKTSGCRVSGPDPASSLFALLLLGLRRRVRS